MSVDKMSANVAKALAVVICVSVLSMVTAVLLTLLYKALMFALSL